jgi:UDP-N-acetylmuramoyl-L-alanyl-D-glutamate--2,6-diaminopimelate ligase
MVAGRCQFAVLEATSHGLAQERLEACHFDVAVLTNVTREHLDYHGTFANYREAKGRLFDYLSLTQRKPETLKVAVINADDPSAAFFEEYPADLRLTYGLRHPAQVMATQVSSTPGGLRFESVTPSGDFPIDLPLPGEFNALNALAAIAVAVSQNIEPPFIQEALRLFPGVVGRLERVVQEPVQVIIDFAHTPHALEEALRAVRLMSSGKVWVVFGCAGLRDREKRSSMGKIAGQLAERVVITAEDPRTESLEAICAEIAAGCRQAGRKEGTEYWIIVDRAEAIQFAIRQAQPQDLVLITGKGHERSMCFGSTEYPWSDHQAVREALTEVAR